MIEEKTVVQLRKVTVERLKKIGSLGDTYDDVITRLLDRDLEVLK